LPRFARKLTGLRGVITRLDYKGKGSNDDQVFLDYQMQQPVQAYDNDDLIIECFYWLK